VIEDDRAERAATVRAKDRNRERRAAAVRRDTHVFLHEALRSRRRHQESGAPREYGEQRSGGNVHARIVRAVT
jgi:hypothetical protein